MVGEEPLQMMPVEPFLIVKPSRTVVAVPTVGIVTTVPDPPPSRTVMLAAMFHWLRSVSVPAKPPYNATPCLIKPGNDHSHCPAQDRVRRYIFFFVGVLRV